MPRQPLYPHIPKSSKTQALGSEPPREKDKREAIELASQAVSILREAWHMNDFDSALWRLVDAAGLVARYSDVGAVGREGNPTEQGYIVMYQSI